jgi:hypothetical protein
MRKILLILIFCLIKSSVSAFTLSPEARISLLTCEPGEEVYAKFGHTAIRVQDAENGIDAVFNYGIFDFNAPNFLFRFVKGETDYILGVTDFEYFVWEYESRGSAVVEQVLNLTQEEKQGLFDALLINHLPENRTYRYNYFFDNCSTRPRVMVENAIYKFSHSQPVNPYSYALCFDSSEIVYSKIDNSKTFRQWVSQYVGEGSWLEFGIDLLIGSRADLPPKGKESLFLPDNLMFAFENAQVNRWGELQPLVAEQHFVVSPSGRDAAWSVSVAELRHVSTLTVSWLLFLVVLALSFLFYKKK